MPIKMSKYWNSQEIVTIIIIINFKCAFFSFCVTQKKIVLVFQVIGNRDHLLQSELSNMKVSFEI